MKRRWAILRWACNALVVLAAAAWLWSGWHRQYISLMMGFSLIVSHGQAGILRESPEDQIAGSFGIRSIEPAWDWGFDHLRFLPGKGSARGGDYWFVPIWFLGAVLALPTAAHWAARFRARHTARTGRCPMCNYSLTGLPPGSPCPECGKRAESKA